VDDAAKSSAGAVNPLAGGSGGSSAQVPTKADCKLVELALRENWSIPDSTRTAMIAELASVIEEEGIIRRKPRLFLACAKAITALSRGNLSSVDTAIRARAAEELEARLTELEAKVGG
jgi:hypothetical protein